MKAHLNRPIVVLPPNCTTSIHWNILAGWTEIGHTTLIRRYIRDWSDSLQKGCAWSVCRSVVPIDRISPRSELLGMPISEIQNRRSLLEMTHVQ
jgi:hypothetical protein